MKHKIVADPKFISIFKLKIIVTTHEKKTLGRRSLKLAKRSPVHET